MSQITALVLSVVIELPIVLGVIAVARVERRLSWPALIAVIVSATLLTHPIIWHLNHSLAGTVDFWTRIAFLEAGVVAAEAAIFVFFAGLKFRVAFVASLLANAASFGVGITWWYFAFAPV